MMKRMLWCLVLLAMAGCAQRGDPRLQGTFVSDKEATLEYLESINHGTPQGMAWLARRLGILEVTWHGCKAVSVGPKTIAVDQPLETDRSHEGVETNVFQYKIIETGTNHLVIEQTMGSVVHTSRVDFVADGYWVTLASKTSPDFKEKFRRIDNPTR